MITNNLLIRLKQRDAETRERAKEALLGMKGKIPALLGLRVETDARGAEAPYDLMLICRFESLEGMREYLNHPAHLEASAYITGIMEQGASLCYDSPQGT
jgi:hypothetical protein